MRAYEPWSSGIHLTWERALRYYEHRLDPLRALENSGRLLRFEVTTEGVMAELPGQIEFRLNADHFNVFGGYEASGAAVSEIVALLVSTVQPRIMTSLHVALQQVIPVEGDYDEVRSRAADRMFGGWFRDSLTDWAMLVDGKMPGGSGNYQAEFGIVSREEVLGRFRRTVGRMAHSAETGRTHLPKVLPAVALFMDTVWVAGGPPTSSSPSDAVATFLDICRSQASVKAQEVYKVVLESLGGHGGSGNRRVGGS